MPLLRPPLRTRSEGAGGRALTGAHPERHRRAIKPGDHLYLIDGSGFIFRAYHALPPLSRKADGLPTGAVSGFCNMLWKLIEDTKAGDKPSHLAVIFDAGRHSFRNEMYPEYKANRDEPPDDLTPQFPLTRDATRAFGVPAVEKSGFEADDLIATYARLGAESGHEVVIVSSDKDLMQLVRPGVSMFDPIKNKPIGEAEVREKFGVGPDKVVDVQALAGDSTDNVPGVPGIGVKTAAELITQYGDLDTLLQRAGEIKQPKRRETLLANRDKAEISRKLVTLKDDAPAPLPVDKLAPQKPDPAALLAFLQRMGLRRVIQRLEASGMLAAGSAEATAPAQQPQFVPAPVEATVSPHLGPRPTPLVTLLIATISLAACAGGGGGDPSASPSTQPVGIVESPYGRVWLRLPTDFPLLADGQPLQRLDITDASGAIWSDLGVEAATRAAVDDLQRLGWEVAAPTRDGESQRVSATRDAGACPLTIVVAPFGARTSLVVYLGEGCPQP